MAEGYTRGRQQHILEYFWANESRAITIMELEKHFERKYDRTQLMASMAHMVDPAKRAKFHFPIEKLSTGVWRLNKDFLEKTAEAPKADPGKTSTDFMMVEVLKEKQEFTLVEDVNDGKLYKMYLVG